VVTWLDRHGYRHVFLNALLFSRLVVGIMQERRLFSIELSIRDSRNI